MLRAAGPLNFLAAVRLARSVDLLSVSELLDGGPFENPVGDGAATENFADDVGDRDSALGETQVRCARSLNGIGRSLALLVLLRHGLRPP